MAHQNAASLALDGGDPRLSTAGEGIAEYSRPALRNLHDPSVTIEEYFHYATVTRAEERNLPDVKHSLRKLFNFHGKHGNENTVKAKHPLKRLFNFHDQHGNENTVETNTPPHLSMNMPSTEHSTDEKKAMSESPVPQAAVVTDEEWIQASRALRTATWGALFYLITTDVLGPYSVPWAMSQMGYGPGVVLYTIFGALAGYTGYQMWQMFLHLDSNKFPMKTFGDIAFRVYGTYARHAVNILQSIQLIFNVGTIIIGNGQGVYEINSNICYIACCVIWAACGMVIGQIRTLKNFGFIANFAIWLNVIVMIMTMAVVSHTNPNYSASNNLYGTLITAPPASVQTTAGPPEGVQFTGQVVGLMQAVYSYGGAMLYCEFMSEMRKPWDFWKAIICADLFIYCVYIFFGIYVYSYQGQYTINPANQGMSPKAAYTAGNIISFLASLIAAALYGNIGIKVLYQNIFKELIGLPDLTSFAGKWVWVACVPIYWGIAFVVAAAIPNFSALSGLIGALCIMQFTYTFPPLLMLGMQVQRDAIRPEQGEGYNPITGQVTRHDSGIKRIIRGFLAKRWYIKLWNLIFFLGAFATCILGTYSSVLSIISAFESGRATAFSCIGPI